MTNMKTYKDLRIDDLRKETDIDFAHYTYRKGQCSCCYGPRDQASIHWKDRKIRDDEDVQYIIFNNSDNGSGAVKANDTVSDIEFIEWGLTDENLEKVCSALSKHFGEDFIVVKPISNMRTIIVLYKYAEPKIENDFYTYEKYKEHYIKEANVVYCNGEITTNY